MPCATAPRTAPQRPPTATHALTPPRSRPPRSPAHAGADGQAPLTFTLNTRGDLTPGVSPQSVGFQNAAGATVLTYSGLKVWDADGTALASRFEQAGEKSFRLVVDERALPILRSGATARGLDRAAYNAVTAAGLGADAVLTLAKVQESLTARGMVGALRYGDCLLYTSPSPRDRTRSRMPSSACKYKRFPFISWHVRMQA